MPGDVPMTASHGKGYGGSGTPDVPWHSAGTGITQIKIIERYTGIDGYRNDPTFPQRTFRRFLDSRNSAGHGRGSRESSLRVWTGIPIAHRRRVDRDWRQTGLGEPLETNG